MANVFDVIVIGAGPAGLTAATYLARAGLSTLVFKDNEGSNLEKVPIIGNWFATPETISGPTLLRRGEKQTRKYGAVIKQEEVLRCQDCSLEPTATKKKSSKSQAQFMVKTMRGEYEAKALVIAAGMQIKSAGITNEFKYFGRGVAVCVACDGPFFKNKTVMVIGAGNLAANEALELLAHTKTITVNLNGATNEIDKVMRTKLKKNHIAVLDKKIAAVHGNGWISELEYMDHTRQPIQGLFLATGTASAVDFAKSMGLLMRGNALEVDKSCRTSLLGVWAAGDVTGPPRQVGKSVGDGVRAAIDIIEHMRGGSYVDHRED
ncbi:MAG: NAD(P)/FAD-dependent oxidoreductase [Candidatus Andersenbacteria bacterium]